MIVDIDGVNVSEIEPNLFYNALKNLHHFGFEDTYDGCISYNQTEWLCSIISKQDLKTEDKTFHIQSIHLGLINFSFLTSVSLFQAFSTFALNRLNLYLRNCKFTCDQSKLLESIFKSKWLVTNIDVDDQIECCSTKVVNHTIFSNQIINLFMSGFWN